MASPDRIVAAPVDSEVARLLKALAAQRADARTTARGRIALDDLADEVEARLARLAHRKEAADGRHA